MSFAEKEQKASSIKPLSSAARVSSELAKLRLSSTVGYWAWNVLSTSGSL